MASSAYNPGLLGIKSPLNCGCQELLAKTEPKQYGWLRKRCRRNKLHAKLKFFDWPQYYVLIVDTCLYYYKNETSKKPAGAVSLYGYNRVFRSQEVKVSEVPWSFRIEHIQPEMKSFYFACSSEREMIRWMAAVKNGMLAANNIENSPNVVGLGDDGAFHDESMSSWGSSDYNSLEASVYNEGKVEFRQSVLVEQLKGALTIRSGDEDNSSDNETADDSRGEEGQYEQLSQEEARSGTNLTSKEAVDFGYHVLHDDPGKDSMEPESNDYWKAVHFSGSKHEASEIINNIAQNGVYLVRRSDEGLNVLQTYAENTSRKYRIFVTDNGQHTLSQVNGPNFDSLEDLLFHYYTSALPHTSCCLIVPYKLHPVFIDNEKH